MKRAPDLVPAVVLAARLLSRRGDFRAASKMVERAWDEAPHPELAAAYLDDPPRRSSADRFARATALARRKPDHPESRMLVAEAALATRDFARAREAMAAADRRGCAADHAQCLMMADIEETENGESGLLREWLARASRAPRDPTWVADGVTSVRWAPASPITGKLDAFQWETPREELGAPQRAPVTAPVSIEEPKPAPAILPAEPALPSPQPTPVVVEEPPVVAAETAAATVEPPPAVVAEPPPPAPPPPEPVEPPPPAIPVAGDAADGKMPAPRPKTPQPVVFPLAAPPDDPGPRPSGAPYSGGFHS